MPDRDIFSRNVDRNWRKASRLLFHPQSGADLYDVVHRSFQMDLQSGGLWGFRTMCEIVASGIRDGSNGEHGLETRRKLDAIPFENLGKESGLMKSIFERIGTSEEIQRYARTCSDEQELRIVVARHAIAQYADAKMCPTPVLNRLRHDGTPFSEIRAARARAIGQISRIPGTAVSASQILKSSSDNVRRVLKPKRKLQPQTELLSINLTPQ